MVQGFYILSCRFINENEKEKHEKLYTQICFARRHVYTVYINTKILRYQRLLMEQAE